MSGVLPERHFLRPISASKAPSVPRSLINDVELKHVAHKDESSPYRSETSHESPPSVHCSPHCSLRQTLFRKLILPRSLRVRMQKY